jgi:TATA-box binding protein (TBP) (component of TFIID and TFIIIB)
MKTTIQTTSIIFLLLVILVHPAWAQKAKTKKNAEIKIAMEPGNWEYDTASIKFITHRNVKAAYVSNGDRLFLKNHKFSNGTIEYDVELGRGFPGIVFRLSDDRKTVITFISGILAVLHLRKIVQHYSTQRLSMT